MGRASAVNRFTLWCFFDFFWIRGSLWGVGSSVSVRKKVARRSRAPGRSDKQSVDLQVRSGQNLSRGVSWKLSSTAAPSVPAALLPAVVPGCAPHGCIPIEGWQTDPLHDCEVCVSAD